MAAFKREEFQRLVDIRKELRGIPGYGADTASDLADYVTAHADEIAAAFAELHATLAATEAGKGEGDGPSGGVEERTTE